MLFHVRVEVHMFDDFDAMGVAINEFGGPDARVVQNRTVQYVNVYVFSTCLEFKQVQPGVWFRERKGIFTRTLLPVRGSTPKVQIQKVL